MNRKYELLNEMNNKIDSLETQLNQINMLNAKVVHKMFTILSDGSTNYYTSSNLQQHPICIGCAVQCLHFRGNNPRRRSLRDWCLLGL